MGNRVLVCDFFYRFWRCILVSSRHFFLYFLMNKLKPALEFGYDPPNSCLKVGFYRQLSKIYTSKLGSPTQPGCKQRSYKKSS